MSFHALYAAWLCREGTPAARLVMQSLAGCMNDESGRCDPSQAWLSWDTGFDVKTVRRALAELEERGEIRRVERRNPTTGARVGTDYHLAFADQDVVMQRLRERRENRPPHTWPRAEPKGKSDPTPLQGEQSGRGGGNDAQGGGGNAPGGSTQQRPPNQEGNQEKGIGKRAKARTRLPDNFPGEDLLRATPAHHTVLVAREARKFRDHHEAKGSTFASWEAAWRTWMRNAHDFAGVEPPPPAPAKPVAAVAEDWALFADSDELAAGGEHESAAASPADGGPLEVQRSKVRGFLETGPWYWLDDWGPHPGQPGCRIAPNVLAEFGIT